MEEIAEKIEGYRSRAKQLLENGQKLAAKGELEKAGEFLWGSVACYINALQLLHTGKAYGGHSEMVRDAKKVASDLQDNALLDAVKAAEKFHANYYHSMIPRDEFPEYAQKARYAHDRFGQILERELSHVAKKP